MSNAKLQRDGVQCCEVGRIRRIMLDEASGCSADHRGAWTAGCSKYVPNGTRGGMSGGGAGRTRPGAGACDTRVLHIRDNKPVRAALDTDTRAVEAEVEVEIGAESNLHTTVSGGRRGGRQEGIQTC